MDTENSIRQIRDLIAADELLAAIQQLRAVLDNSPKLNEAILHMARFQDISKQIRRGTVSYAEASLTKNQIRTGLLDLLQEMEQGELTDIVRFDTDPGHKVLPLLTERPAIDKKNFVGREKEMRAIYRHFFPQEQGIFFRSFQAIYDLIRGKRRRANNARLLILSGEGGIGKTTLAAQFFHVYEKKYRYVAWVVHEHNKSKALADLAKSFQIHFPPESDEKENLQLLFKKLGNLHPVVLLVLDNADDMDDLRDWYGHLLTLSNFHILLTSRITKLGNADVIAVEGLSKDNIVSLFHKYYPLSGEERQILNHIRKAVDDNTLVLELMAKNLAELNKFAKKYTLSDLLTDLNEKGLLAVRQSFIEVLYRGKLHKAKPEDIIAFMYDLDLLTKEERMLLTWFSVLPVGEKVSYELLELIFGQSSGMDEHLNALTQKGWLRFLPDDHVFQCNPVIREMILRKNDALQEDCRPFVEALVKQLDEDIIHRENYKYSIVFCRYARSVVQIISAPNLQIAKLYDGIGNFYSDTGDLENALYYFQEYRNCAAQLCELEVEEPYNKHELGMSYKTLGDTYIALGNLSEALNFFEQYNQLEKNLYESYPENIDFKRGLSISYERLGSIHTVLGDLNKALTFFDQDNRLAKELCSAHPENINFKKGLAVSYSKLGDTHTSLGNLNGALTFFEQDIELAKELYESYPQNVEFKNNLAISYSKLGDTHTSLGDLVVALTFFEQDIELAKELHESYPQNVEFKNNLAISYERFGSTQTAIGGLGEALTFYGQYNQLAKELHESYPQNVEFKNNLAISYERLGTTHKTLGDLVVALAFFGQYNQLAKELHESYPQNVEFKNNLAISYERLGTMSKTLGNLDGSLSFFEQFNQLMTELYETYPEMVDFKDGLAVSYSQLGAFYRDHKKDNEKAKSYFQQCYTLWKELSEAHPTYVEFTKNFTWAKDALK